jgi:hypothetical protein
VQVVCCGNESSCQLFTFHHARYAHVMSPHVYTVNCTHDCTSPLDTRNTASHHTPTTPHTLTHSHCTKPHHITLYHTHSHHITLHHTHSHTHTTSHFTSHIHTPYHTALHHTTPYHTQPHPTTPHTLAPVDAATKSKPRQAPEALVVNPAAIKEGMFRGKVLGPTKVCMCVSVYV